MSDFLNFVSKLGVMKPSSIDVDNNREVAKMNSILMSNDYAAEEKLDGCHYMVVGCRFFSTDLIEKTNNFPHIRDFLSSLNMPNLILDGEIHYPGKTSQYCTRVTGTHLSDTAILFQNKNGPIHYSMWDMLRTPKGTWLLNVPYYKRRQMLEQFYNQFIKGTEIEKYLHITTMTTVNKKEYYEQLIAEDKEGIVLKKLDSYYVMGKKPKWQWMKLKKEDEADFFISGYEAPTIKYNGSNIENWPFWREVDGQLIPVTKLYYNNWIGAIELSAYVDGVVTKICTTAGINEALREQISQNSSFFLNKVVKVSYMEKTEKGIPRHPRFKMFHESKQPHECTWELGE